MPHRQTYHVQLGPLNSHFGADFPFSLRTYLAETMAIRVEGAHFMPAVQRGQWDGKIKYFGVATASFYTGLLEWVEQLLRIRQIGVAVTTERMPALRPRCPDVPSHVTLRDYQAQIVEDALHRRRGIIQAAVNAGKTEIALEIIRRLRLTTLYIVPTKALYDQALEAMETRLPDLPCGEIRDGPTFEPQLITVAMIQSLVRMLSPWGSDAAKRWIKSVECIIGDECHHSGGQRWSLPFKRSTSAQYRFGLSATPLGMGKARDMLLIGLTGPVFGAVTTPELVKRGLSVQTEVRFIAYTSLAGQLTDFTGKDYAIIYQLGIEENAPRALAGLGAIRPHLQAGQRVCLFVDTIDHGDFLRHDSQQRLAGTPALLPQLLYGSEPPPRRREILDRFTRAERPFLITTLLKEGVNIPEIDVLVNAGGRKSEWLTRQQGGRVLRTRTGKTLAIIYDFIDGAHALLLDATAERHRAYRKEGFTVTLVDGHSADR